MATQLLYTPFFPSSSLVLYYQCEGNSNDSKGSNNGTDTSITYSIANGKYNQGAGFNGTTSKIACGSVTTLTNTSFSIAGWFKLPDFAAVYEIFSQGNTSNNSPLIQLAISSSTAIATANRNNSSVGLDVDVTTSTMVANTWYHVAWTCSTTSSRLYLNGLEQGSATTFTANTATGLNVQNWGVLQRISSIRFWPGQLDDMAIFNAVLSPEQVMALYTGQNRLAALGGG